MILKISFLLTFLFIGRITLASDVKYVVSDIPKYLLSDAKAVIRKNEVTFEIESYNKAVEKINYAITILNKNGIENSILKEVYTKFTSVKKIKTTLYDQYGKIIRTGLNTSILDIAAIDGYTLYDDYRVKLYDPEYATVPFTIEYSFEIDFNGLLSYPEWDLYNDYNISSEKADFTVIAPEGFKFRYLEKNITDSCRLEIEGNKVKYKWSIGELKAIRKELYSQSIEEFTPKVYLSPDEFEIGGYSGRCDTWNNFGQWIYKLGEKRNILNPETQKKIKSLVEGAGSDTEKIRILYKFMQNKVRYVSIQEGIGGWQPIDAETVDKVSYGDCKALANYMKSLLDLIGLKSFYTIIRAGEDAPGVIIKFPSNRFNHAIVCVPVKNDTIWLECTDQQIPFGFLGTFTDDRKALIVDESGGKMVNTTVYSIHDNYQNRSATFKVSWDGAASAFIKTVFKGTKYDEVFGILRMDDADKRKYITDRIAIPNFELLNFNFAESKSRIPTITESINISIRDYGLVSGSKLILKPNLISRLKEIPLRSVQRNSPIQIRRSFCESDSLLFLLQGAFYQDIKPTTISVKTEFGEFRADFNLKDNKLSYIRSFKLFKCILGKEKYDSFVDFFEKVQAEDNRQIILTKL
jgi:hypothetical protein